MAMVDVDDSCHFSADSAKVDWLGLRVGGHPALSLHSSDELGELLSTGCAPLLQCLGRLSLPPFVGR